MTKGRGGSYSDSRLTAPEKAKNRKDTPSMAQKGKCSIKTI